jgi:hypothetical protein
LSRGLERAEIGAAGALGQQLSGLALPLAGLELGKDVVANVGRRIGRDQRFDHSAAGSKRAPHSDVGLVEQIVGRIQRQRRVDAGPPRIAFQCLLRVQNCSFGLGERRRLDDLADVVAPAVVALQPCWIAVGLLGPPRHWAAHQLTDTPEVGLSDGQLVWLQVIGHRELQARVGFVPVEAHGAPVVLRAVALRFLRRAEGQPVHRLDVVLGHGRRSSSSLRSASSPARVMGAAPPHR